MNTATYSKYRRTSLSENAKVAICAVVICLLWGVVSEMDYQEAVANSRPACEAR